MQYTSSELVGLLKSACHALLTKKGFFEGSPFVGGLNESTPFRPTQREAIEALLGQLGRDDLSETEKLIGYFEIPTGVGKTGLFLALLNEIYGQLDGRPFNARIIVPNIPLLEQIEASIAEGYPNLHGHVGIYGDGKKRLDQPVTIATYNAWLDLTEAGALHSDNTNFVIYDEAHRTTSERRQENISLSYRSGPVIDLALSATAHFDDSKTVQTTHYREIYAETIQGALRKGELAEYISIIPVSIRVQPLEQDVFAQLVEELGARDVVRYIKKKGWISEAIRIFEEQKDIVTGRPIYEQKTGFYVSDTYQADELEKAARHSPILNQYVQDRGLLGVAVAIHSNMPADERWKRRQDFKNGRYMALIGDEMFKEGFDYPPLKTIIDTPHGSRVDKVQIIGRGARHYGDIGLTFVDTTIYYGSDDAEHDEIARERSIAAAVKARDILDGVLLIRPNSSVTQPIPATVLPIEGSLTQGNGEDGSELTSPAVSGVDVPLGPQGPANLPISVPVVPPSPVNAVEVVLGSAAILDKESIKTYLSGREDSVVTNHAKIDLDTEIVEYLKNLMDRKGIRPVAFLKKFADEIPDGLSSSTIYNWISGTSKVADGFSFGWVLKKYASLPDLEKEDRMDITPEMRQYVREEVKRTGVKAQLLSITCSEINKSALASLIEPNRETVGTIIPLQFLHILAAYECLPTQAYGMTLNVNPRIIERLQDEKKRTGVGGIILSREMDDKSIDVPAIDYLINGRRAKVELRILKKVFRAYAGLPTCERVELNSENVARLQKEIDRTRISSHALLDKVNARNKELDIQDDEHRIPDGLTRSIIYAWTQPDKADVKTADKNLFEWVLARYREFPDNKYKLSPNIPVTPAMREKLSSEQERTNVGSINLLASQKENPFNLDEQTILSIQKGRIKFVAPEIYGWIISAYKVLPDAVPLSATRKALIKYESTRTRMGAQKFHTRFKKDLPEGLTIHKLGHVFRGSAKSVTKPEWDFLVGKLKSLPTKIKMDLPGLDQAA